MQRLALICLISTAVAVLDAVLGPVGFGQISSPSRSDAESGRPGRLDGVWQWTLPDTPNGLRPTQSGRDGSRDECGAVQARLARGQASVRGRCAVRVRSSGELAAGRNGTKVPHPPALAQWQDLCRNHGSIDAG